MALIELCRLLDDDRRGMTWGWGASEDLYFPCEVLFLDLPTGQVSWPYPERMAGPDYCGRWDGTHANEARILGWVSQVIVDVGPARE